MFPLIGSLISGASSLAGSYFSSQQSAANTQANIQAQQSAQAQSEAFNASEAQQQMNFQSDQAQTARDYTTQMSNTAYQRAQADMKAAGLNPILAAGASESTPSSPAPSGASASVGTPNMALHNTQSMGAGASQAVSNAVNTAVQLKTYDKMTDEIANLQAQEAKTAAETRTEGVRPALLAEETGVRRAESTKLLNEMPASKLVGTNAKDILNMPDWLRSSLNIAGFAGNKAADVVAPFVSSALGGAGVAKLLK